MLLSPPDCNSLNGRLLILHVLIKLYLAEGPLFEPLNYIDTMTHIQHTDVLLAKNFISHCFELVFVLVISTQESSNTFFTQDLRH